MVRALPPCPVCGQPVVYRGVGAPPTYCSKACKYKAGYARHPERTPQYRAKNPAKIREIMAHWRSRHPDKQRENNAVWYQSHREWVYRNNREWRRKNPVHAAALARNGYNRRRARLQGAGGALVRASDWLRLVRRYGGCCAYCGKPASRIQMDHVIPLSRGGRHAIGNLLPSCAACNRAKGARFLTEWRYGRRGATSGRGVHPDVLPAQ